MSKRSGSREIHRWQERPNCPPRILLYTRSPYLMGIITYNGLTGIFAVKTVVVDRSVLFWPRCVFP